MKKRTRFGPIAVVAALRLGTFGTTKSPAPLDMYLKIDTVNGASKDSKHPD
jgi:hypothetical protein